jgi:XTP/dITP diphosphohydrolase
LNALKQLLVATTSAGKLREIEAALAGLDIELLGLRDRPVAMPEETGASFEENAALKARAALAATGLPALADDSGLEVDALDGEPGVRSARWENLPDDQARYRRLLETLRGRPDRTARFVSVIVLALPGGEELVFRGEAEGWITDAPRGDGGFGYDPVFHSVELGKTFAEATLEEKAAVSHRGRALAALRARLAAPGA